MDQIQKIKVIYEDNHIIAVIKPAGVLTHTDGSGNDSLERAVKDYLKIKYNKPGNVFLGLVHRLDRPVQGIVLFGKTSKGTARIAGQFRDRIVQKTYHAIVWGQPHRACGQVKEKISKISFFAESFAESSDDELLQKIKQAMKTRTAELSWTLVRSNRRYSLLKIVPKTGRFHQIRLQMANMGCPILGDNKYAGGAIARRMDWADHKSIALAATGIKFRTATEGRGVDLKVPLPAEWIGYIM